jgi:hypothetical protein
MKPRSVSLAVALFATLSQLGSALASVVTSDPNIPVLYPNGVYLWTTGPTYVGGGLTVTMSPLQERVVNRFAPTIIGPNESETYQSTLMGMMSVNLSPPAPMSAGGPGNTLAFGKAGFIVGTFNTELLSLNLNGSSPFGPFMIRESPTLASTGQTTITNIGGGLYRIDSFFDVFTELSIDGGNSWIPSQGSSHVVLDMPEPGTAALLGSGGLLWFGLRRRRARR